MYTCGPTVYDYLTVGNFRTFVLSDVLRRVLKINGYEVKAVMNITDVGHLTGDNLGNADTGEDRLEKGAKREGKSAWEVASFYTDAFLSDIQKLNLLPPDILPKATDHIQEQIQLIKALEEKDLTYKTSDGIYFDTVKFEEQTGKKYGELSTLDQIKTGARVEENPEKKNPRDFALWKFSPSASSGQVKRQMEWDSPWGLGFPGWHIECSAMAIKYLGETFDIHVGGEDLRSIHHPNEIAQSEGATGKQFVKYWVHGTFLLVDGKRMGKSVGNAYIMNDVESKGFNPLSLRYLYLTAHYRDQMNFTWEALRGAQTALERLRTTVYGLQQQTDRTVLSEEKESKTDNYRQQFLEAINNDLSTAQALAVVWEMMKSNIPSSDKYDMALYFDEVLGLGLGKVQVEQVPEDVQQLVKEREEARKAGDFAKADELRDAIKSLGYVVKDTSEGPQLKPII